LCFSETVSPPDTALSPFPGNWNLLPPANLPDNIIPGNTCPYKPGRLHIFRHLAIKADMLIRNKFY
jgi:hypothetical protein